MDYVTQIIDPPPSRTRLLLDGVRALRKPKLDGARLLPKERLVRAAAELSGAGIEAYGRACGFAASRVCRCPIPMCWRSRCT